MVSTLLLSPMAASATVLPDSDCITRRTFMPPIYAISMAIKWRPSVVVSRNPGEMMRPIKMSAGDTSQQKQWVRWRNRNVRRAAE